MLLSLDTDIDVNKLAEIVLKQEKRILKKYPPNSSQGKLNDGNTGLGESSLTSRFNSFNVLRWKGTKELKESILRGIYSHGFEKPSNIQYKCIPVMNKNKDIIAQSQSGTGKTGAFCIGILNNILCINYVTIICYI